MESELWSDRRKRGARSSERGVRIECHWAQAAGFAGGRNGRRVAPVGRYFVHRVAPRNVGPRLIEAVWLNSAAQSEDSILAALLVLQRTSDDEWSDFSPRRDSSRRLESDVADARASVLDCVFDALVRLVAPDAAAHGVCLLRYFRDTVGRGRGPNDCCDVLWTARAAAALAGRTDGVVAGAAKDFAN